MIWICQSNIWVLQPLSLQNQSCTPVPSVKSRSRRLGAWYNTSRPAMVREDSFKSTQVLDKYTISGIQIYSGPEPRRSDPLPKKSSPPSGPQPSFPGGTKVLWPRTITITNNPDRKERHFEMFSFPGLHPAFLHPGSSLYPSPFPPGHPLAGSVLGRGGGEGGHPLAGHGGHHPLLGRPSVPHPSLFPSSVSQHHPLFSPGIISGHLDILA